MIRVRVTQTWGSTPREVGAEMFVTPTGSTGTIGGGRLEFDAIARARQMIAAAETDAVMQVTLGPDSGQCCGGPCPFHQFQRRRAGIDDPLLGRAHRRRGQNRAHRIKAA